MLLEYVGNMDHIKITLTKKISVYQEKESGSKSKDFFNNIFFIIRYYNI